MTELSGYETEFVDPPKELQTDCSICLCILREPFMVKCCGMSFCKLCIKPIVDTRKPQCPLCKGNPNPLTEDKRLSRQLSQFKVYCSNRKAGCEWIGILAEFDNHLNNDIVSISSERRLEGCSFVKMECLYCDDIYTRGELLEHEENCPQKIYPCEHCQKFTGTLYVLENQHYGVCDKYPVDCSNDCGGSFPRCLLNSHLSNDCPLTTVNCDYHYAGCEAWFMRRDLDDHMTKEAKKHASLLHKENMFLMGDIHELEFKLESVVFDCATLVEYESKLDDENIVLRQRQEENENELATLFAELKHVESEASKYLEELKKVNAACKEKSLKLNSQIDANKKLQARIAILEKTLDEEVLDKIKKQSLLDEWELKNTTLQDELVEYKERFETLLEELDDLQERHEIELRSKEFEIDKDQIMIAKLEKKLKSDPKPSLPATPSSVSLDTWPDPFDPYRECTPPMNGGDEFVSYQTYHELRSTSSTEVSPTHHVKKKDSATSIVDPSTPLPQPSKSSSPTLSHTDQPTWADVVTRKPKPSLSAPVKSYSKAASTSKSKTLPLKFFKLMIRNTPSKQKAKDEEIIKLFSQFGRVYNIDRKGSNTAVMYDNIGSVRNGVYQSEQKRLKCGGITLNCTYEKLK